MCDYLTELAKVAHRYNLHIILLYKPECEYKTVRLIGDIKLDTLISMIYEEFTCSESKLTVDTRTQDDVLIELGTGKLWYEYFVYNLHVKPVYDYPLPVVYQIKIKEKKNES
jgi:hypothetical protein